MLPTFIVAGASKSGTTSLWQYLHAHPEVCMTVVKEVRFFTAELPFYARGLSWYEGLFSSCAGAIARGEISPVYMISEDSPRLIHKSVPGVQILFIFRNPVDRMYSQYWFQRQLGKELPEFDELVQNRLPRLKGYLYANSYQAHLKRFLEYFPGEQLTVFLYDDLQDNQAAFMQKVYQAIGVNPSFVAPNLGTRYNAGRMPKTIRMQRFVSDFGQVIMNHNYPLGLHAPMAKFRKFMINMITVDAQYPPMAPETRELLVEEYDEVIAYVEQYLDRPLPSWRRTQ